MKVPSVFSLAVLAFQFFPQISAAGSVCSSGIYAALAPLETYAPAVSYCKGQAGKATVTVTVSAANVKVKRAKTTTTTKSTTTTTTTKPTTTTLKTTTTTSSVDAKASSWSSLVQQAQSVVATFCSCAGYPATSTITVTSKTTTTTTTITTTTPVSLCTTGVSAGQVCMPTAYNEGPSDTCESDCESSSNYGQGCGSGSVDANGNCILNIACCVQYYLD